MEDMVFLKQKLEEYINFLLNWRNKVNVLSRKIDYTGLFLLLEESLLVGEKVFSKNVVDAGSGNGILGIPMAIRWPNKSFTLVETINKKVIFLNELVKALNLLNVKVARISIQEFFQKNNEKEVALISRGFPDNTFLYKLAIKKRINELLIITSKSKAKIFCSPMENFIQNQYNIPWRDHLVIFKMENVSRETKDT